MKPQFDEVLLHNSNKVDVECCVNEQIYDLLAPIPPLIDPDVGLVDLQAGWDPDAVDRDVDGSNEYCHADLDTPRVAFIMKKDGASVDDNLEQKLDLEEVLRGGESASWDKATHLQGPKCDW